MRNPYPLGNKTTVIDGTSILVTGGTGSFGHAVIPRLLTLGARRIRVYSRDEYKQSLMREAVPDARVNFFLGDVRDARRLRMACRDVDIIIHAAALKQVPALEYNPIEAKKTNVDGAQNIIEAALDGMAIHSVLALSTDKAVNPLNVYGASKLMAESLFRASNAYRGAADHPRFSCVRYGNVAGSRGSVIPAWRKRLEMGCRLELTDKRMTRFWITPDGAVDLVLDALDVMEGGEIFVPKIPSFRLIDLAAAMTGNPPIISGIRAGEKLHEALIGPDEGRGVWDAGDYYVLSPHPIRGTRRIEEMAYTSDTNPSWLTVSDLRARVESIS